MQSDKQGVIKYHFLSFWYDPTWDWTLVSRAIGKHSTNALIYILIQQQQQKQQQQMIFIEL